MCSGYSLIAFAVLGVGTSTTCGDVKNAYKQQACCGKPTATFDVGKLEKTSWLFTVAAQEGSLQNTSGPLMALKMNAVANMTAWRDRPRRGFVNLPVATFAEYFQRAFTNSTGGKPNAALTYFGAGVQLIRTVNIHNVSYSSLDTSVTFGVAPDGGDVLVPQASLSSVSLTIDDATGWYDSDASERWVACKACIKECLYGQCILYEGSVSGLHSFCTMSSDAMEDQKGQKRTYLQAGMPACQCTVDGNAQVLDIKETYTDLDITKIDGTSYYTAGCNSDMTTWDLKRASGKDPRVKD